jgi:hypothetical protein
MGAPMTAPHTPADRLMLLLDLAAFALRDGDDEAAILLVTEADLTARQLVAERKPVEAMTTTPMADDTGQG